MHLRDKQQFIYLEIEINSLSGEIRLLIILGHSEGQSL